METVRVKHSAVRTRLFTPRASHPKSPPPQARPRSRAGALYRHLDAAFHQYADDMSEDSFPTFLESLLIEHIAGDPGPRVTHRRIAVRPREPRTRDS